MGVGRQPATACLYGYNDGMNTSNETHSVLVGYILWLFGFTGSHRFYFGKPITGTIWFFTGGLLLIGWIIDLFLIPGIARRADLRFQAGPIDYNRRSPNQPSAGFRSRLFQFYGPLPLSTWNPLGMGRCRRLTSTGICRKIRHGACERKSAPCPRRKKP